jgi:predicted Na+-dependent transporter
VRQLAVLQLTGSGRVTGFEQSLLVLLLLLLLASLVLLLCSKQSWIAYSVRLFVGVFFFMMDFTIGIQQLRSSFYETMLVSVVVASKIDLKKINSFISRTF